jgi:hypothetical protein
MVIVSTYRPTPPRGRKTPAPTTQVDFHLHGGTG